MCSQVQVNCDEVWERKMETPGSKNNKYLLAEKYIFRINNIFIN